MRPTALFYLYRTVSTLALPFIARTAVNRLRRAGVSVERAHERLGHATTDRRAGPLIWVHAAHEDDVQAVLPLIAEIAQTYTDARLILTSSTAASAQAFGERLPARAVHQFSPLDGLGPMGRFLRHWRPDACVLVNSDLWPTLLDSCARAAIPVALLDVRLSEPSAQGWKRFPATASFVLRGIEMVQCLDMASRNHLRDMGLEMAQVGKQESEADREALAARIYTLASHHAEGPREAR